MTNNYDNTNIYASSIMSQKIENFLLKGHKMKDILLKIVFWAFEILGAIVAYSYSLLYVKDYMGAFIYGFTSFNIAIILAAVVMDLAEGDKTLFSIIVGKFAFGIVISGIVNAIITSNIIDGIIFGFILIVDIAIEIIKYKKNKN